LAVPSSRELELNELHWWANWAELKWFDRNAYILTSKEFPESFFNRAGVIACRSIPSSIRKAESRFRSLDLDPVITVYDACSSGTKRLIQEGYRTVDTMTVMISAGPSPQSSNSKVEVRTTSGASVDEWSLAYLYSFYGEAGLMPAVTKVVRRLQKVKRATLLEARLDGYVAGVLALFKTKGMAGVYCVGTVPKFRRRGVAGALLAHVKNIALSEGRSLVLQTLRSDGAEQFYSERGFSKAYRKNIMEKQD
jgi:GNAT superfamily N-acetyltransferase